MNAKVLVALTLSVLVLGACAPLAPAQQAVSPAPAPTVAVASQQIPTPGPTAASPVELRLAVSLLPDALRDFQRGVDAIQAEHPEWKIKLEVVPQQGVIERYTTELSAGKLPDVILVAGLYAQQWIRQNAFEDLTPYLQRDQVDLEGFYPGTVAQFAFDDRQWGVPADAAPEVVFYNKAMFDTAKLPYPTDDWTYEDMAALAARLTLDREGRNPSDPAFDPQNIVQWGWNSTPQHLWSRVYLQALGADFCRNADCTEISMTDPAVVNAFRWWADKAQKDHSAPYDTYSGGQTGIQGDPFINGQAAMGFNNSAAIGQLNSQSTIQYDVVQPFKGADGKRHSALSTQGYVIAATSPCKEEAWQLVRALTSDQFLTEYVGRPGHSIPAKRSAAQSALDLSHPPANQQALLAALEYGEVIRPFTASAFEAYAKTVGFFIPAMKGDLPLETALRQIEEQANAILKKDR
jgi:multiple sugar transport system substrate-binding protein